MDPATLEFYQHRAAGAWAELTIGTEQGESFFRGPTLWHAVLTRKPA
jgi:hypothetical protein